MHPVSLTCLLRGSTFVGQVQLPLRAPDLDPTYRSPSSSPPSLVCYGFLSPLISDFSPSQWLLISYTTHATNSLYFKCGSSLLLFFSCGYN